MGNRLCPDGSNLKINMILRTWGDKRTFWPRAAHLWAAAGLYSPAQGPVATGSRLLKNHPQEPRSTATCPRPGHLHRVTYLLHGLQASSEPRWKKKPGWHWHMLSLVEVQFITVTCPAGRERRGQSLGATLSFCVQVEAVWPQHGPQPPQRMHQEGPEGGWKPCQGHLRHLCTSVSPGPALRAGVPAQKLGHMDKLGTTVSRCPHSGFSFQGCLCPSVPHKKSARLPMGTPTS